MLVRKRVILVLAAVLGGRLSSRAERSGNQNRLRRHLPRLDPYAAAFSSISQGFGDWVLRLAFGGARPDVLERQRFANGHLLPVGVSAAGGRQRQCRPTPVLRNPRCRTRDAAAGAIRTLSGVHPMLHDTADLIFLFKRVRHVPSGGSVIATSWSGTKISEIDWRLFSSATRFLHTRSGCTVTRK